MSIVRGWRVTSALVAVTLGACSQQADAPNMNLPTEAGSTGILSEKCWATESGTFIGAIAIYDGPKEPEAILYSALCPTTSYEDAEAAYGVRAQCVKGIPALSYCKNGSIETDQKLFNPGANPEFPTAIYAIKGTLSGQRKTDRGIIFQEVEVSSYQRVPKEMFGAVQYDGANRPDYIKSYLDASWLDENGYRILR